MNKTISDVIYLPVDELKPYENNSRSHSARDINAIVASIHETGFNDPIGIWGKDNIIVEGHGRLEAAQAAQRDVDNVWELSDREKEIVKRLDNHEGIELARENKKGE